jgi:hypothetical protein
MMTRRRGILDPAHWTTRCIRCGGIDLDIVRGSLMRLATDDLVSEMPSKIARV